MVHFHTDSYVWIRERFNQKKSGDGERVFNPGLDQEICTRAHLTEEVWQWFKSNCHMPSIKTARLINVNGSAAISQFANGGVNHANLSCWRKLWLTRTGEFTLLTHRKPSRQCWKAELKTAEAILAR